MGYQVITKKIEASDNIIYYQIDCIIKHPDFPILPIRVAKQKENLCLEIDISNKITFPITSYKSAFSENDMILFLLAIAKSIKLCKSYFLDPSLFELTSKTIFYKDQQQKPSVTDFYLVYIPLHNYSKKDPLEGLLAEFILDDNNLIKYPNLSTNEFFEFISNWSLNNIDEGIIKLENLLEISVNAKSSLKSDNISIIKNFATQFFKPKTNLIKNKSIIDINSSRDKENNPIKFNNTFTKLNKSIDSHKTIYDSVSNIHSDYDYVNDNAKVNDSVSVSNIHSNCVIDIDNDCTIDIDNDCTIDIDNDCTIDFKNANNIKIPNFVKSKSESKHNKIRNNSIQKNATSKTSFKTVIFAIIIELIFISVSFMLLWNQNSFNNKLTPILITGSILMFFIVIDLYFLLVLRPLGNAKKNDIYSDRYIEKNEPQNIFSIKEEQTVLLDHSQKSRIAMLCSGVPGTLEESLGLKAYILVEDFLVGRDGNRVDFKINNLSIGRIHARITKKENSFFIEDLDSRNGTFLNRKRLKKHEEYLLPDNCKIRFAEQEFFFVAN